MAGIWYRAGAVSVTSGSKKVTGFGTQWQTSTWKVEKGHAWYGPDGKPYEIDYVESDTVLYLVMAYGGPTAASQSYAIDITRTGTIPAFSRQLSAQLAYAQGQFESWQQILTGADMVTLTAPDGQQVQVPSLSAFQPTSASLKALQALTPAKDKLPVFNGPTGAELITLTAFMRTLLDDASLTDTQKTLQLPTAGGFSFRNKIINGAMVVAQRGSYGTSGTYATGYTVDRWVLDSAGTAVTWDTAISTSLGEPQAFLRIVGALGNTGSSLWHRIEAANCGGLWGKQVTLSFRLHGNTPSLRVTPVLHCPNSRDNFSDLTFIQAGPSFSTPSNSTWGGTVSFTFNALPVNVMNGLSVAFSIDGLNSTSAVVAISEVQLEVGEVATPFEHRPYGTELALCQRYYQTGFIKTLAKDTNYLGGTWLLPVEMRIAPTLTYSYSGDVNNVGSSSGMETVSVGGIVTNKSMIYADAILTGASVDWWAFDYTLVAEL